MATLCSTPLNELVMVQAITEWTRCLEEAGMSLDTVRVRDDVKEGEREKLRGRGESDRNRTAENGGIKLTKMRPRRREVEVIMRENM